MTACVPYSEATSLYEPSNVAMLGVSPAPRTVLDFLTRFYPETARLFVENGFSEELNNDPRTEGDGITVFVYAGYKRPCGDRCRLSSRDAVELCRASYARRKIDAESLASSPLLVLRTTSESNDAIVTNAGRDTFVNGSKVVRSERLLNGYVHVTAAPVWSDLYVA